MHDSPIPKSTQPAALSSRSVKQLSADLQHLFNHAKSAAKSGNRLYAADLLLRLLVQAPDCNEARHYLLMVLNGGQAARVSALRSFCSVIMTIFPLHVTGPRRLRSRDLEKALQISDRCLRLAPTLQASLFFMYRTCMAAGFEETAAKALELCHGCHPDDIGTLRRLIGHWHSVDDAAKEMAAIKKLRVLLPEDLQLQTDLKQAMASATIQRDRWEEAESYRDVIRDKDEAELLEKQLLRGKNDEKTVADLLKAAVEKLEKHETTSQHRVVGDLHLQKKDYAIALEHYRRADDMMNNKDPGLDDCITRALRLQFDDAIDKWRGASEKNPAYQEEAERRINEILHQKEESLFQRAQQRVKRFPLEMRYRFELGEFYLRRGELDAALREFQAAAQNPSLRVQSLLNLGKCMARKGITDLAVDQLKDALESCPDRMNEQRKDILYTLALLYLEMGKREEALGLLKQVYVVDADFREVDHHIQTFYTA